MSSTGTGFGECWLWSILCEDMTLHPLPWEWAVRAGVVIIVDLSLVGWYHWIYGKKDVCVVSEGGRRYMCLGSQDEMHPDAWRTCWSQPSPWTVPANTDQPLVAWPHSWRFSIELISLRLMWDDDPSLPLPHPSFPPFLFFLKSQELELLYGRVQILYHSFGLHKLLITQSIDSFVYLNQNLCFNYKLKNYK